MRPNFAGKVRLKGYSDSGTVLRVATFRDIHDASCVPHSDRRAHRVDGQVGLTAKQAPPPAQKAAARPAPIASHDRAAPAVALDAATAAVRQYCTTCHNDRRKAGGLTLAAFDATHAAQEAPIAEKIIRKLRAGMMPPPGAKRPDEATLLGVAAALETHIDQVAATRPHVGPRPFQRLNRAEYARSIRDLLALEIDVDAFLPPDTSSGGFDNVADVQVSSATLMQGYLRAATRISWLAIGDRNASASEAAYSIPRTASQMRRVDGAPIGTRGGISVLHVFPADGEYSFRMMLASSSNVLYGSPARGEQIEVSIDGERVALMDVNPRMTESDPNGMNIFTPLVQDPGGTETRHGGVHSALQGVGRRPHRTSRAHARGRPDRPCRRASPRCRIC